MMKWFIKRLTRRLSGVIIVRYASRKREMTKPARLQSSYADESERFVCGGLSSGGGGGEYRAGAY